MGGGRDEEGRKRSNVRRQIAITFTRAEATSASPFMRRVI